MVLDKKTPSFFKDLFQYIEQYNKINKENVIRYLSLEKNNFTDKEAENLIDYLNKDNLNSNTTLWFIHLKEGNEISEEKIKKINKYLLENEDCSYKEEKKSDKIKIK